MFILGTHDITFALMEIVLLVKLFWLYTQLT